jgi:hypothetical protein
MARRAQEAVEARHSPFVRTTQAGTKIQPPLRRVPLLQVCAIDAEERNGMQQRSRKGDIDVFDQEEELACLDRNG